MSGVLMSNVFCRNCGKEISDQADVCIGCGVSTRKVGKASDLSQTTSKDKKNKELAFLFTFLWPGVGHLYLGRSEEGMKFVIANGIGCVFVIIFFPVTVIIWLVTLIKTMPNIGSLVDEVNSDF